MYHILLSTWDLEANLAIADELICNDGKPSSKYL